MATQILLKHPQTGIVKTGLYGFSWTSLFFGGLPAMFRGDILIGLAVFILSSITGGIAWIIWAFIYNKKYTLGLIEKGYILSGTDTENDLAKKKLGII